MKTFMLLILLLCPFTIVAIKPKENMTLEVPVFSPLPPSPYTFKKTNRLNSILSWEENGKHYILMNETVYILQPLAYHNKVRSRAKSCPVFT